MSNLLEVCSKLIIGNDDSQIKVDYIGRGNVWINNTYDISVIRLARNIIYEAIDNTAPGQLSILGYDSDLSGIFAPFAALSSGQSKQLEIITDERAFKEHLEFISQRIQAVQNVVQGRNDSLIEFRNTINRPVEGYLLVVLSLDMGLLNKDLLSKLSLLMKKGPAFGVSFLIISTTFLDASGEKRLLSANSMAPNITVLEADGNSVFVEGGSRASFTPMTADTIIQKCDVFMENIQSAQLPVVPYSEIHDMEKIWTESSMDGVSFSIGKYGINDMEITIGDEINQRHNVVITGAVGQGKSNLLSVIIHSLCHKYSPRELQMYLLDFKEGVTFKPFSNIGKDDYLPHAKVLGLESDVNFGIAVLKSLYTEYERRMRILKENNVKSLRELRRDHPAIEMPRIVVVIDEFQMMFGDDMQTGQLVAELLEKSVRLFRASGIHFILSSQTLDGGMALAQKKDSIFSQVPIRIALKNSVFESQQTLSLNNSAAAFLRPREAVVNLDYGEISQNRKTVVAFADESVLKPIRKEWWEKAGSYTSAPNVFEGDKRITVSSCVDRIKTIREEMDYPVALVGEKISVNGELIELPLSDEPGRNIAIIGTPDRDCNQAVGIMQSIAISLALQNPKGNARFIFCDFEKRGMMFDNRYPEFAQIMENAGCHVECIDPKLFEETINELTESDRTDQFVYVFGSALDRWEYEKQPYGQESPLKEFVERSPSKNIHFIGWWIKASSFTDQVAPFGNSDAFNSKIFLRLDERAVQSLTNPFIRWNAQSNRALVSDSIEFAEEMTFIPFSPADCNDVMLLQSQIRN